MSKTEHNSNNKPTRCRRITSLAKQKPEIEVVVCRVASELRNKAWTEDAKYELWTVRRWSRRVGREFVRARWAAERNAHCCVLSQFAKPVSWLVKFQLATALFQRPKLWKQLAERVVDTNSCALRHNFFICLYNIWLSTARKINRSSVWWCW